MLIFSLILMLSGELQTDKLAKLPPPREQSQVSLEEALARRRSIRAFDSAPLALMIKLKPAWMKRGEKCHANLRISLQRLRPSIQRSAHG
jgi:ABC-type transporter Mla MlaB component